IVPPVLGIPRNSIHLGAELASLAPLLVAIIAIITPSAATWVAWAIVPPRQRRRSVGLTVRLSIRLRLAPPPVSPAKFIELPTVVDQQCCVQDDQTTDDGFGTDC